MALLQDIDRAYIERGIPFCIPRQFKKYQETSIGCYLGQSSVFTSKLGLWYLELKGRRPLWTDRVGTSNSKGYGDEALIQHIGSLKSKGKIGVVVPMGVRFRGGKENQLTKSHRSGFDLCGCWIGTQFVLGASIPAALILKKGKEAKWNKVLLSMPQSRSKRNRTKLFDQNHIEKIAGVVNTYSEEDLFSRIVDKEEIRKRIQSQYYSICSNRSTTSKIDIQKSLQNSNISNPNWSGISSLSALWGDCSWRGVPRKLNDIPQEWVKSQIKDGSCWCGLVVLGSYKDSRLPKSGFPAYSAAGQDEPVNVFEFEQPGLLCQPLVPDVESVSMPVTNGQHLPTPKLFWQTNSKC